MSSFPLSNCSFNSNNCMSSIESVNTVNNVQTQKSVSLDIWHQRLGHPSSRVLSQVVSSCNLHVIMKSKLPFCIACKLGKSHALPIFYLILNVPNLWNWFIQTYGDLLLFHLTMVIVSMLFLWMISHGFAGFILYNQNLKFLLFFPFLKLLLKTNFLPLLRPFK